MSVTQATLLGDTFGSKSSGTVPVGGIIMWSGSTAPTGWALCNGQNGTPDLRDRFIVGSGSNYSIGATGGANTVTLTTSQIPSHNHAITDPGHFHSTHFYSAGPFSGGQPSVGGSGGGAGAITLNTNTKQTGITGTNNAGGGEAHENRPPYYALAFIMRVS